MDLEEEETSWNEMVWFVGTTTFIHTGLAVFWILFFAALDRFQLFQDARFQKPMNSKYAGPDLATSLKQFVFIHLVMTPSGLPGVYYVMKKLGMTFGLPGPQWSELLWQIPVCFLVEDAMFYWLHRLMHTPFFYRHVHKLHHTYHQPTALASEYAHPIEHLTSNFLPLIGGPLLLRCHVITFWVWLTLRLTESYEGHSGYDLWFMPYRYFPFRPGAQVHDYHHSHNKGNYGSFFTFWDKLCGTDESFNAYKWAQKQKQLHTN